ncbi:MAG: beta-glucosidase [Phycisphaerae bacterium]|nr:beta-glucosidase [Phycisphaerae bacterium]
MPHTPFQQHFLWGASTSSYQIEGALHKHSRGDSVWDMAARVEGFIARGETAETACDHVARLDEDLDLMAELGLKAYRFSIAWPRVIPAGVGGVSEEGVAFYERLVDGLLARGIEPLATLFHWDYPTALFQRGGWLSPDSPRWFADYAALIARRFGDRVKWWVTLNEPQCFIGLGHELGQHAPALKLPLDQVLTAAHHALLAHGLAVDAVREHAAPDAKVSLAPIAVVDFPASDEPADIEAARRGTFERCEGQTELGVTRMFNSGWWFEPVVRGAYPESFMEQWGGVRPPIASGDMDIISRPIDFLGMNLYHGRRVRAGADGEPVEVPDRVGAPTTTMGWPITPDAMYWMARFFHERYELPLVVTENGRAVADEIDADGRVRDTQRIAYLDRYLRALGKSIADGADVAGYFAWSLMDNFEWTHGYAQRFGLVHVDFDTQKRTIKDSGRWYASVIQNNGPTASIDAAKADA